LPERRVLKAMCAPSGDQDGSSSFAESFVTFVCPLPLAFMTQTSNGPAGPNGELEKAIFVPSGDQSGSESDVDDVFVRFVCPLPSEFMA
jgi:hypothetical protein